MSVKCSVTYQFIHFFKLPFLSPQKRIWFALLTAAVMWPSPHQPSSIEEFSCFYHAGHLHVSSFPPYNKGSLTRDWWNLSATIESACAPRTRLIATLDDVGTEGMSERLIKWIWTQSRPWSCKNMWTFWDPFICVKVLFLSFAVNLQSL